MSDTIEKFTVSREGLTLSKIVWRRFRRQVPGLVEKILDINPGLAAVGSFLPVGTEINIPVPAPRPSNDVTPVRLW